MAHSAVENPAAPVPAPILAETILAAATLVGAIPAAVIRAVAATDGFDR